MTGYTCLFCKRTYKEKFNLDRHVGFCQFTHQSRRQLEHDIDAFETTPTVTELFCYMKEMSLRMDTLEKENQRLRVFANQQRKKIDIVQWLNDPMRPKPAMDFTTWIHSLPLYEYLRVVFQQDLLTGFLRVFEKGIEDHEELSLPICAFSQKPNQFYIYNGDAKDPTVQCTWQVLSSKQMDRWLGLLSEKFSFVFKQWCDENKARIDASDDAKDEYYAYFEKILGGKMSDETRNHRIRQVLFSKLKQNMKQLVELEFV